MMSERAREGVLRALAEHAPCAVATEFPRAQAGAVSVSEDAVIVLVIDQTGREREFAFPPPLFAAPDELVAVMALQRACELMLAGFN